jgi:folate-binding Fe-S cluster repair protein YgfZ
VGGVNFKKGCYPGQEVVARSQFRGTLKRRGFVVHSDAALAAGQEIFNSTDAEQPVGLVVQAASAPQGGWDAIVSLQLATLESGSLHSGSSTGAAIAVLPLPYALLEDI